jgi:uncharacterized protein (DUF433 family)
MVCPGNPPRGHTSPATPDRAGRRDRLVGLAPRAPGHGANLTAQAKGATVVQECVNDERPFSTRRFKTDGRTIFLDSRLSTGESELLDLKKGQYVFKVAIERTFKDLDIEDNAVARWRPFHGKETVVIDPQRAFGQPIASEYGVPTIVLSDAVKAEGSVERVAYLFEVPAAVVRDAVKFEEYLLAA